MSALDTLSVEPSGDLEGLSSAAIVPMVETLLRDALERLDLEAAAAHAEASASVAAAVRRSTALIRSHGEPAALPEPQHLAPPPVTDPSVDELGPDLGDRTPAQVYDLFWSEIPSDQPIRERLRRWAQRPPM